MQSNKASKKTRKDVSEPVAVAETEVSTVNEKTAKPRPSKSSQSKNETGETASAKKHRKAATVSVPETTIDEPVPAKAMAAAAGSSVTAAVPSPASEISQQRVQELAYRFWLADGRPEGSHFEHWLRAERELGVRN